MHDLSRCDPDHNLRSSDIADGIQCVARISRVVAFAVFERSTTICIQEDELVIKLLPFSHKHIKRGRMAREPDHNLDQILDIHHCSSLP